MFRPICRPVQSGVYALEVRRSTLSGIEPACRPQAMLTPAALMEHTKLPLTS
jgi:hypothetical protein